jgi:hypothetical protein
LSSQPTAATEAAHVIIKTEPAAILLIYGVRPDGATEWKYVGESPSTGQNAASANPILAFCKALSVSGGLLFAWENLQPDIGEPGPHRWIAR